MPITLNKQTMKTVKNKSFWLVATMNFLYIFASFYFFLSLLLFKNEEIIHNTASFYSTLVYSFFYLFAVLIGMTTQYIMKKLRPENLVLLFLPPLIPILFLSLANLSIIGWYMLAFLQTLLLLIPIIIGVVITESVYYNFENLDKELEKLDEIKEKEREHNLQETIRKNREKVTDPKEIFGEPLQKKQQRRLTQEEILENLESVVGADLDNPVFSVQLENFVDRNRASRFLALIQKNQEAFIYYVEAKKIEEKMALYSGKDLEILQRKYEKINDSIAYVLCDNNPFLKELTFYDDILDPEIAKKINQEQLAENYKIYENWGQDEINSKIYDIDGLKNTGMEVTEEMNPVKYLDKKLLDWEQYAPTKFKKYNFQLITDNMWLEEEDSFSWDWD